MWTSDSFITLMFHKISKDQRDGLTITIDDLLKYIHFFKKKSATFLSAQDVVQILRKEKEAPYGLSVFLSFDDGYQESFELLEANYEKIDVPLTCFVPVQHVGGQNQWDQQQEKLLGWSEISRLAENDFVQFALHSYAHRNYKNLTAEDIQQDIVNCTNHWAAKQNFVPLMAYPYGGFDKSRMEETAQTLSESGIVGAFRIGNRRNNWGNLNPYFIERIDIRGDQSFFRNVLNFYGVRL